MKNLIEKDYRQIEFIYNTQKGKNFIIHLMKAFLPINPASFWIADRNIRCCISERKSISISEYNDAIRDMSNLQMDFISSTTPNQKKIIGRRIEEVTNQMINYFELVPEEDPLMTRRMYYSEKSEKVLSLPAIIALNRFYKKESLKNDFLNGLFKRPTKAHNAINHKEKVVKLDTFSIGDLPAFNELKQIL